MEHYKRKEKQQQSMYERRMTSFVEFLLIAVIILLVVGSVFIVTPIPKDVEYDIAILRWTKVGAVGGWIGSIFAAIALIVSLIAFALPQKVSMDASVSIGSIFSQSFMNRFDIIEITVSNTGIKPFSVNGIYLGVNGNDKLMFVGLMSDDTILKPFMPIFPVRLNEGESFNYYVPKDKLCDYFLNENYDKDMLLEIIVDEMTTGKRRITTDRTIQSIING